MRHMRFYLAAVLAACAFQATAQEAPSRYTRMQAGYLMVLRKGDSIIPHLEALAIKEKIPSATFTGLGFVNVTFGFFNAATKEYDPRHFDDVEMASMTGSIAWQKGKPSIHAHGVVTGKDFQAYGGHILNGVVSTGSLEIMIHVHPKRLERKMDEDLGANVLSVE